MKMLDKIWHKQKCLSIEKLSEYIDGKLSRDEVRQIEHHLSDCELCSDVVDGLSSSRIRRTFPNLNVELLESVKLKNHTKNSISINYKSVLSIAASFAIVIAITLSIYKFANKSSMEILALSQSKPPEIHKHENIKENTQQKKADALEYSEITENEDEIASGSSEFSEVNTKQTQITNLKSEQKNIPQKIPIAETIVAEDAAIIAPIPADLSDKNNFSEKAGIEENTIVAYNTEEVEKITERTKQLAEVSSDYDTQKSSRNTRHTSKKVTAASSILEIDKDNNSNKIDIIKFNQAIEKYKSGNYFEAQNQFQELNQQDSENYEVLYYSMMCSFKLKKYPSTINFSKKLLNHKFSNHDDEAKLFKAKALIETGKKREAKRILKKLARKNGKFQEEAKKILKKH